MTVTDTSRPYRGRRLSWQEFYALRPDLRADNNNQAILPNAIKRSKLRIKNKLWWRVAEVKFEPEILRDILLYVEKHATRAHVDIEKLDLPKWDNEALAYHVKLAKQDGLLDCTIEYDDDDDLTYIAYSIHGITAEGHRLVETIRDPVHWRSIKTGAAKLGNLGLATFVSFASAWVKLKVQEKTGLNI